MMSISSKLYTEEQPMSQWNPKSIDIFCKIIDNFGDIGVSWRLAKELKYRYPNTEIYLIVDHLDVFQKLEPTIKVDKKKQILEDIVVLAWDMATTHTPSELTIEAFACHLPEAYMNHMPSHTKAWINLEYLTYEAWAKDCHLKPAIQPNGLTKYNFFPIVGGILKEAQYFSKKDRFLANPIRVEAFVSKMLTNKLFEQWQQGAKLVSLFAYPNAPIQYFVQALEDSQDKWIILHPEGSFEELDEYLKPYKHIFHQTYPMLSQNDFDALLQVSEYNCVRGEDSFIRALLSEKPFIWQLYPQSDNAHLTKLQAWFDHLPFQNKELQELIYYWNTGDERLTEVLSRVIEPGKYERWCGLSQKTTSRCHEAPDLIEQLMSFCHQVHIQLK